MTNTRGQSRAGWYRAMWPQLGLSLVLLAALEGTRALGGAPWRPSTTAARWGLVLLLLQGAQWAGNGKRKRLLAVVALLTVAAMGYLLTHRTSLGWVTWALLLVWVGAVTRAARAQAPVNRILTLGILCVAGGLVPVLANQIEVRFSDEEFFVAVQAALLTMWTTLFAGGQLWLASLGDRTALDHSTVVRRYRLPAMLLLPTVVCLAIGLASIYSYRQSFYPSEAPSYPGISPSVPFVCGRVDPDPVLPSATETFERLVDRVQDRPVLQTPDYGFLALATGERGWAELFREGILRDAQEAKYTGPAGSVKYGQHLAAQRVWYLQGVTKMFPDLFAPADLDALRSWTEAVNQRAWTIGWVDWAYGLALSSWPAGPYENQDHGLGLLALLEEGKESSEALSTKNRDYLASGLRGWTVAFRNTDDAYIYQPEWIENAMYQLGYSEGSRGPADAYLANQRLSFEWLLLQALPDGAPLGYNHPTFPLPAGTAYLGAVLLGDPRYVWWSARLLDWAESEGLPVDAQPGVERPAAVDGASPVEGSCLLYGNSGLPTRLGPLAPDKIVFRDGWTADSQYLLLNLRFSGWHRYKATNAVVTVYQGGPLVVEPASSEPFSWLPEGRALLRDKRIPRQYLNGLLVPRTGLSAVLYGLTGFGGPWAQDPPHYANVDRFETLAGLDTSRTSIEGWNGWSQARSIYFYHDGPIVVVDEADADRAESGAAAIRWQLAGEGQAEGTSLWLRQGADPARVAWSQEAWPNMTFGTTSDSLSGGPVVEATYRPPAQRGEPELVTTWLLGDWANSQHEATAVYDAASEVVGQHVSVSGEAGRVELLHNSSGNWLEAYGLATDGQAVSVRREKDQAALVCAIGGSRAEVELASRPNAVQLADGGEAEHDTWAWQDGRLVLRPAQGSLCLRVG